MMWFQSETFLKGRKKIYKNDQVIFKTSDSESILKGPYISENNDIAFYTKDINCWRRNEA